MARRDYKDKITMKFSVSQLDRVILALINNGYNKKFASNVNRLFSLFNPALIEADIEKEVRVYLIKEISEIILKNNIEDKDSILSFLDIDGRNADKATEVLNNLCDMEIPAAELTKLDTTIAENLRYGTIMEKANKLEELFLNIKTGDYESMDDAVTNFGTEISSLSRDIASSRESIEDAKTDINLSTSGFINFLGEIIDEDRNPASKIKTGLQALNTMLNGGLEKGRFYCFFGKAKSWKSGMMLNLVSQAKRYNSFTTKDPNCKPVIVYLSMENSNKETIKRLWNHCFGNESDMSSYSKVEAAREFEKAGLFTPSNKPGDAEIIIWYRANRSISTADLKIMLEDLKKEGKEPVFLVVDYMRRIRPAEPNKELRIELSNVANELKTIATEFDIPVVSGAQLNRDAYKESDVAGTFEEMSKAFDRIGASNIGESIDIIQNVDCGIVIDKQTKASQNEDGDIIYNDKFLFVKLIATRVKEPKITAFKHRFMDNNDMKLIEDVNMPRMVSILSETGLVSSFSKNANTQSGRRKLI